jgi:hypothetical protein
VLLLLLRIGQAVQRRGVGAGVAAAEAECMRAAAAAAVASTAGATVCSAATMLQQGLPLPLLLLR